LYTGKAGVGRDFDKARAYFVAAAELGNIKAAHNACIMFQLAIQPAGRKSPRWSATKAALKWFTVAAEKSYASSQFELGNMYALGQGLPVSYEQAVFWYTLAQSNGHEEAGNRRFAIELNLDAAHRARIAQQLQKWHKGHP
jgi:TPR repeat protein